MYNYSSVTVMGVARAVQVVQLSWRGAKSQEEGKIGCRTNILKN
jgi:hypothetical protein